MGTSWLYWEVVLTPGAWGPSIKEGSVGKKDKRQSCGDPGAGERSGSKDLDSDKPGSEGSVGT